MVVCMVEVIKHVSVGTERESSGQQRKYYNILMLSALHLYLH